MTKYIVKSSHPMGPVLYRIRVDGARDSWWSASWDRAHKYDTREAAQAEINRALSSGCFNHPRTLELEEVT